MILGRKSKTVFIAIGLIVIMTTGLTLLVTIRMSADLTNEFKVNSGVQLQHVERFIDDFFAGPIADVSALAANPVINENLSFLTVYKDREKRFNIISEELPPRERAISRELNKLVNQSPLYDMVYVGNASGGFTQAPDSYDEGNDLIIGFDPTVRPWYLKVLEKRSVVITDAYISNTGQGVCSLAAPIFSSGGSRVAGVAGIDIRLDTLTEETAKATIGKTGYVVLLDHEMKVVCDPRNSGPETPLADRWLGKTINQLPAEAAKALTLAIAKVQTLEEVSLGGRQWLASSSKAQNGWNIIFLQEKREVFFAAFNTAISLILLGGIIIVTLLILMLALVRRRRKYDSNWHNNQTF